MDDYGAATSFAMLDSGNFVLYGNDSNVIWESFDFPIDTILRGQNIYSEDNLVSSVYIRSLNWTLFTRGNCSFFLNIILSITILIELYLKVKNLFLGWTMYHEINPF